ncbi:MAG TPA: magnesium chelatase subunit D family protein [Nocardioidaceae bacterium]|nr:magnesium chelatase subunit D family protein [Nocardioidaceae bacterium]
MHHYPFSAVVGSDDLALALSLSAVSPDVGGVLVRGEKGTAKSTMVRALASLLPDVTVVEGCRFSCDPAHPDPTCPDGPHLTVRSTTRPPRLVELPVGATEDRVVGSLHLGRALADGVTEYDPGLLAGAHRGLLYVDEVNLLHDHLVDLLLDAAAMGRSTVERDGVSVSHAARFVLVGTMNPEEGELRPQLLDRFGLSVVVSAPRDPAVRVEVIRRRMAYDADPAGMAAGYADAEQEIAERILKAQALLPSVSLDDDTLLDIARVCAAFEVDGMRADIVTARAAVAHAAWCGRTEVTREDVRVAARLAIPHRRRRSPFDDPGIEDQTIDETLPPEDPDDPGGPDDPGSGSPDAPGRQDDETPDTPGRQDDETPDAPGRRVGWSVTAAGDPFRARLLTVTGTGSGTAGRRSRARTTTGRTVGSTRRPEGPVHLPATIFAAAQHPGRVRRDDVRHALREGRESNLVLLCVDASGSMAAHRRMEQVKAAVLSLLLDAYQRRDKVGMVTFRDQDARLVLPPTGSVDLAAKRLQTLPAGGRTPLAEGLLEAARTLDRERIKDPRRRPLLVVVTDGRATYGRDAVARAGRVADHLAAAGIASVVIDCETGRMRMGLAVRLAQRLGAEHVPVGEVSAEAITSQVKRKVA